jgi:type IV pilus assembly protein PilE
MTPSSSRGFTLIETMVAVGIAGVLSSVAYPSFEGHVLRARRTDALVTLMAAQLAQERHRANSTAYGSLADVGLRATSPAGYYALQVTTHTADGFVLMASATGGQARDAACRHLSLASLGNGLVYASGADASTGNDAATNRKCWSR